MPRTENFVTYEGSLTYPGCYETVTWVVMNNPIYISIDDVTLFYKFNADKISSNFSSKFGTIYNNETKMKELPSTCRLILDR